MTSWTGAEIYVNILNDEETESCENRGEQWKEIKMKIRSWELSGRTLLETIFHAIMKSSERVIQFLLENGFEESSEAAAAARKEIIELLLEPGFPGKELKDFIVDLTIEERPGFQGYSRSSSSFFYGPRTRVRKFLLAIDGDKQIDLRLLYRKEVNEYFGRDCDNTLLSNAILSNDQRMTRLLLNQGADVNIKYSEQPLHIAVKRDTVSCDILQLLLSQKNVNVNISGSDGRTPVQIAVEEESGEKMTLLVQHGANLDLDYVGDSDKGSALHFFILRGCVKEVERLLKHGANVDRLDKRGQSPLHNAAKKGHDIIAKLLIENGATVDCQDTMGKTPLMFAAMSGLVKVWKTVLEAFTIPDSRVTEDSTAASSSFDIQSEVKCHGDEIQTNEIKFDNESNGDKNRADQAKFEINGTAQNFTQKTQTVDLDGRDNEGETAMYHAVATGRHTQIVETLLSQGANPDIADNEGDTPLLAAVWRGNFDIANKLLEYGADPNIVNCDGLTALSIIVLGKNIKDSSNLEEQEIFTHRLLDHGADIRLLVGPFTLSRFSSFRYDITALRTVLEYELATDLGWFKKLYNTISKNSWNDQNGLFTVLAEYILKLKAAGILTIQHPDDGELEGFLHTLTLEILKYNSSFKLDSEKYEEEVMKMTGAIDGSYMTIHDLLLKSSYQLAQLARNDALVQTLKKAVSRFPLYAGILQGRLEKGLLRRRYLNAACRVCHLIFCQVRRVPYEVTERVVMNLDDQELRRFVLDHKRDPFWQKMEKQRTKML